MTNKCSCESNTTKEGTIHYARCSIFDTALEANHLDEGKPGLHYVLAMPGLLEVARVGDFGAAKYSRWNYKNGMAWMKLAGSCSRHLTSWILGEDYDKESGLHHLAHLIYDALMLLDYKINNVGIDDRYTNDKVSESLTNSLPF